MIIAKYETEIGSVYGKISLFNFLACLADTNKNSFKRRYFVLKPLKVSLGIKTITFYLLREKK